MRKRIAFITSDQQRHRWVAARLAVIADLVAVVSESKPDNTHARPDNSINEVAIYFQERESREAYWFSDAPQDMADVTSALLKCFWGKGSSIETFNFLVNSEPEIVFLFGSSIIRENILSKFPGRIINMHLGLSPYYRGSSTNFWPLVHGVPECVGVTVHHATLKIDGGNILSQVRPDADNGDSSHDLGCKSIIAGATLLQNLAQCSNGLFPGVIQSGGGKLCRRDDFNLDALQRMKSNFSNGMIESYIQNKECRDKKYPIINTVVN